VYDKLQFVEVKWGREIDKLKIVVLDINWVHVNPTRDHGQDARATLNLSNILAAIVPRRIQYYLSANRSVRSPG
jgi:hypothetical protein